MRGRRDRVERAPDVEQLRQVRMTLPWAKTGTASVAVAAPHDIFAKGGVARLPVFAMPIRIVVLARFVFPHLPPWMPGQGGRREGGDQDEGNKTFAHCRTGGGFLITSQLAPRFSDVSVTPYLAAERPHQSFSGQN